MRTIFIFCLIVLLSLSSLQAQRLEPFGLEGKSVTSLAISPFGYSITWGNHLFAGTDGTGIFARNLSSPDSDWVYLGLTGKKITSLHLYHWGVGPGDFNTPFAGVEPDLASGDSTLVYQYTSEGKWVPADSGIDRRQVQSIRAMDGFSYSGHEPPQPLYAAGDRSIYRCGFRGVIWEEAWQAPGLVNVLKVDQNSWDVWAGGNWGRDDQYPWIAKSEDRGTTWQRFSIDSGGMNSVLSIAIHPQHPDTVYAGLRNAVMKSTNGGNAWIYAGLDDAPAYFNGLAIDSGNSDHMWAGGPIDEEYLYLWVSPFALWESYDGGESWRSMPPILRPYFPHILSLVSDPKQAGVVYISTEARGVWRYQSRSTPPGTIKVPEDYATIQAALDAAADGDTVLVGPRTYVENIDFQGKGVLLISAEGSEKTIIDGNYKGSVVTFASGEDSTACIKGFTLRNGSGTLGVDGHLYGGGIYCYASSPKILHNVITGNIIISSCGSRGGGMAIMGRADPIIDGNYIFLNMAASLCDALVNYGGGVYVAGSSRARFRYNIIARNHADYGGGMAIHEFAQPTIQKNSVSHNRPNGVWIGPRAQPVIGGFSMMGNDIVDNSGVDRGQCLLREGQWVPINAQYNYFGLCPPSEKEVYPLDQFDTQNCSNRSVRTYFPMEIGNRWTFGTSYPITESIIDTVTVAGLHFFRFDQFRGLEKPLLRLTEDGKLTWRLDPMSVLENVWVNFAAEIGERWKVSTEGASWTVELESKSDTVTVPAGTFTNCYRFFFDFGCCDNSWAEWYAPGIGAVKRILYGYAMIEYPLTSAEVHGIPVGVDKSPGGQAPTKFALHQNYPNPFNATTTIHYELSVSGFVTLEIYNLMGQRVRTVIAQRQQAGSHQAQWDGTDDFGAMAPSGVYMYRLRAGAWSMTRKLLLLR